MPITVLLTQEPAGSRPAMAGHFALSVIIAGLVLLAAMTAPARADDVSCVGDQTEFFTSFQDKFLKDNKPPAPLAAQPVTTFLPGGDDAALVFRAPFSTGTSAVRFRLFETDSMKPDAFKNLGERDVLSTVPVPDEKIAGFKPADSTLIRFLLQDTGDLTWGPRTFVVLRCVDGKLTGWGMLRAQVSNLRATVAVCIIVLALAYLLAMIAVRRVRAESHPLAGKYPAYRSIRPLAYREFWNPIHLTADVFHRGSVQKFQVVLFSFLVGGLLLSLVLRRGVLVDLSPTIVALLGISGIGAAVAQGSTTAKNRMSFDNWTWLVKKRVLPITDFGASSPRWRDLVTTNREFDIYKLQTVIFTIAVAFALIAAGASSLSSFEVPGALLGILGLSQVVYVAGILVRPSVEELDKAITDLRKAEETAKLAVLHNVDVDTSGNLPALNAPPPNVPFPVRKANAQKALQRYNDLADRVEIMIESTLETAVERHRLDPDIRENRRTLGPEGGPGGVAFSVDWIDDGADIHSLAVWSGAVIDAIQVTYRDRNTGQLTVGARIGGPGGGLNQIDLEPGEYITRVEGRLVSSPFPDRPGEYVASISLQTNRRRVPAGNARWGGEGERGFDFTCEAGEEVIGFEGRCDDYISALGVIVRTRR